MTRLVVVPGAPVLLPRHASLTDPVADLRAACHDAVRWLLEGATGAVTVVCLPSTEEVARHLLPEPATVLTVSGPADLGPLAGDLLVVADGSARRGVKAPGHLDVRAEAYDAGVTAVLRSGELAALRDLDLDLGRELLAGGAPVLRAVARSLAAGPAGSGTGDLTYAADPFGVQYWVLTWTAP